MRAFLGIPIPGQLAEELSNRISSLRKASPGITWVRPENYHITMLFLGEIDDAEVARVSAAIDSLHAEGGAEAVFGELGQFPPKGFPRVVYAGLDKGREFCEGVFQRLSVALPGYSQDRGYAVSYTHLRAHET